MSSGSQPSKRGPKRYSDDELLGYIRAAYAHLAAPLYPRGYGVWYRFRRSLGDLDVPSSTTLSNHWGSLDAACAAAGVPHREGLTETPGVEEALAWARRARADVDGALTVVTYREWQRRQRRAGIAAPPAHLLIGHYSKRIEEHIHLVITDYRIRRHNATSEPRPTPLRRARRSSRVRRAVS